MTNDYEMADDNRADLILEKQDLLAPMLAGMVPAPHPMYPGADHGSYYRGDILRAAAEQGEPYDPAQGEPYDPARDGRAGATRDGRES